MDTSGATDIQSEFDDISQSLKYLAEFGQKSKLSLKTGIMAQKWIFWQKLYDGNRILFRKNGILSKNANFGLKNPNFA